MFVIVNNGQVVLGPMRWNRFRFENFLVEELEIENVTLPTTTEDPFTVDQVTKLLPVQATQDPDFNPKIEMLHGPLWDISETVAISSYEVQLLPLDAAKNQLKSNVASIRWNKENTTLDVTINGTDYPFSTSKDTRNLLQSAISSSTNSLNWKINADLWITLHREDIQEVLNYIILHVQAWFTWELNKNTTIDNCTTLEQLNTVVLDDFPSISQPVSAGKVVSMRQARLALLQFGVLSSVDAAIDSMSEPQRTAARIEWEYSSEVQRNKVLVQTLGPALGLTDAQIDALFALAASL